MSSDLLPVGYQQTEMGAVPDDWEFGPLEKFWSVTDCKHVTAKFISVGIPVASIQEVQSRFINLENANQTTKSYYKKLIEGGRDPRPGDLILSRNATVGEISQVASWHPPFAMGQDVCLLRKKSADYSTSLLQSVFQSWIIRNQLENCMVGSTFRRVNVEQIKNLVIPHPLKKAEQEAIATSLSDTDALIEALEQLIAKKRHIKQGTMQELLTGKRRLPGFDEGKGYMQTEVGVIPKDWEVVSLNQLTSLVTNGFVGTATIHYTEEENGITYIQGYNVEENSFNFNGIKKVTPEFHKIHQKSCLREGDLLTVQTGEVGLTTIVPEYLVGSNCHALIISRFKKDKSYPLFYAYYFNSLIGRLRLKDLEVGTTMKHINVGDLLPWKVPYLPKREEQKAIATILSDMDTEIATLEAKLTKTRQLKQGIMHNLLTGRIRLV